MIKINYDPEVDALSISRMIAGDQPKVKTEDLNGIIVDRDETGEVIAVEILGCGGIEIRSQMNERRK